MNSRVAERSNSPVRATFPFRASSNSNSILWCCSEIGIAVAASDIAAGKPRETAGSADSEPAVPFLGDQQFAAGNFDDKRVVACPFAFEVRRAEHDRFLRLSGGRIAIKFCVQQNAGPAGFDDDFFGERESPFPIMGVDLVSLRWRHALNLRSRSRFSSRNKPFPSENRNSKSRSCGRSTVG